MKTWRSRTRTRGLSGDSESPASPCHKTKADVILSMTRNEVIEALFKGYDKDSSGTISETELRQFAKKNGFNGDAADWHAEYEALCQIMGNDGSAESITLEMFARFINDDSVPDCRLSDQELRDLLFEARTGVKTMKTWRSRTRSAFKTMQTQDFQEYLDTVD